MNKIFRNLRYPTKVSDKPKAKQSTYNTMYVYGKTNLSSFEDPDYYS